MHRGLSSDLGQGFQSPPGFTTSPAQQVQRTTLRENPRQLEHPGL
jgi:hypothetical protein